MGDYIKKATLEMSRASKDNLNFQKSISQYLESEEYDKDSVSNSSVDDEEYNEHDNGEMVLKLQSKNNNNRNNKNISHNNNYGDILNNLPDKGCSNIFEINNDDEEDYSNSSCSESVSEYLPTLEDGDKNSTSMKLRQRNSKYQIVIDN